MTVAEKAEETHIGYSIKSLENVWIVCYWFNDVEYDPESKTNFQVKSVAYFIDYDDWIVDSIFDATALTFRQAQRVRNEMVKHHTRMPKSAFYVISVADSMRRERHKLGWANEYKPQHNTVELEALHKELGY